MGIVRRQSVYSTFFIFAGFLIGAVNIFLFYSNTKYFTPDQFGLTRLLPDIALLFSASCTLGGGIAILKFYPFYNSFLLNQKNDLPILALMACVIGCILFVIILPFTKDFFVLKFSAKSSLFIQYFNLLYPCVIGLAFFSLFEYCHWVIRQTVLPNLFRELAFRLISLCLILLLAFKLIDFNQFIFYFALIYPIMSLILFGNLLKNNFFNFTFKLSAVTKRLSNRIIQYTLFIFTGTLLHVAANVVNLIVLASQSKNGLADVAIMTIATYLITLMDIPVRSMTGIATSLLSQAWKDKNIAKIDELYSKTALTLLIAGLFIFGVVLLNTNNISAFMGKHYSGIYPIILILGFSKLIDLGTGLNAQILLSSKFWKIDFYTQILLVLLNLILNYYLIKSYGLIGSAFSTLISFFVYNLIRFLYIKTLFKLQPFSIKNLLAILIASVCFFCIWCLPFLYNIYVDSLVKTILFSVLFGNCFYYLKISVDVNNAIKEYLMKIKLYKQFRK